MYWYNDNNSNCCYIAFDEHKKRDSRKRKHFFCIEICFLLFGFLSTFFFFILFLSFVVPIWPARCLLRHYEGSRERSSAKKKWKEIVNIYITCVFVPFDANVRCRWLWMDRGLCNRMLARIKWMWGMRKNYVFKKIITLHGSSIKTFCWFTKYMNKLVRRRDEREE